MTALAELPPGIGALPYVNWIFWGAISAGTLLMVGVTAWRGGTTGGYRLFMAWVIAVGAVVWLASELSLGPYSPNAWFAELRRFLVALFAAIAVGYLIASLVHWPRVWLSLAGGAIGIVALVELALASGTASPVLFAATLVFATLALGSVNAAMLLGHWYLVTPKLSPAPLRRLIWLLIGALVAEGLLVTWSVVVAWSVIEPTAWLTGLRFFVGIAFPLAIAVLALRATDAPSMQSTTGLLYVGLAAVMAGTIGAASLVYLGWGVV